MMNYFYFNAIHAKKINLELLNVQKIFCLFISVLKLCFNWAESHKKDMFQFKSSIYHV